MNKQWTLTTQNGETLEGLSNDAAARAIQAIMAGHDVSPSRAHDSHEYELEVALAA